jgi:hypothetical protein
VFSVHQLDMLEGDVVPPERKQKMLAHIRDGGFLAPYGTFSIAEFDDIHCKLQRGKSTVQK